VVIGQDVMHIALSPSQDAWKPGRYKVEIHVGEQVNEMSLMGTMRFTIVAGDVMGDARGLALPSDFGELSRAAAVPVPLFGPSPITITDH
jgi:hypothetical protein